MSKRYRTNNQLSGLTQIQVYWKDNGFLWWTDLQRHAW